MSPEKDRRSSQTLTRRTMLRGLGVSMALPWMESLPAWGTRAW